MPYDLTHVKAPVLRGRGLRLMTALLERPALAALVAPLLTRGLGIKEFRRAQIADPPTFQPSHSADAMPSAPDQTLDDVPRLVRRDGPSTFGLFAIFRTRTKIPQSCPSKLRNAFWLRSGKVIG